MKKVLFLMLFLTSCRSLTMEDYQTNISRKKYTYKSSSILDDTKISLIKGMILRGDNLQDIAFWFGVNLGRISEIKSGIKYNDILPADKNNLPPQGPYPSLSELFKQ